MSSRTGSNGCQPPLPGQHPPNYENDDVTNNENVEKTKDFCRDFIWGTCNKGTQCKYCHELEFEIMKKTLKFCHDFQNSSGCVREHCKYLHASKEEQSLFEATGQLPHVLAQRHANMSATAAETIPQIALYIQESLAGPPPPPPPPPQPQPPLPVPISAPLTLPTTAAASLPVNTTVHPPRPTVVPGAPIVSRPAPVMPMQQPPPPPPPPTAPSTSVRQRAPMFTAPPPSTPAFSMAQPPASGIPMYDASKPPPPIPTNAQPKSSSIKRQSLSNDEKARPCKVRKGEEAKLVDILCEQCVQRDLRIESFRQQLEVLYGEEEYQTVIYKKKFEEYQNRKEVLKSLVTTDLFRFVEDNVEGTHQQQIHNILGLFNQSQFMTGVSTVPKQFLLQLMDYMIGDTRTFDSVPAQSLHLDESIIQALSSLPRKTNPVKIIYNANHNHNNNHHHNNNAPPEVLQTFMDILRQLNPTDKTPPSESNVNVNKNVSSTSNNDVNGSHQYPERQNAGAAANSNRFPPPSVHGHITTSPVFTAPPTVASAPPPYQAYTPTLPPAGLYYPPPYSGPLTGVPMAPENPGIRLHIPTTMPPAPPPPVTLAAAGQPIAPTQHPGHYAIGRYPPPYYPRHQ